MDILNEILRQSLLKFLWVGSFAGILVGAGIFFKPQRIVVLNQYLSRWVGAEKITEVFDRPRLIERMFYRHHRKLGLGILIGAAVVLYTFVGNYNLRVISTLVPRSYWWLSDALVALLLIGCVVAALVGAMVLLRPSLLKDIEKVMNRWIITDHLQTRFNRMHFSPEQSMLRHNRLAGGFILLGSLYSVLVLGYFLFSGVPKF